MATDTQLVRSVIDEWDAAAQRRDPVGMLANHSEVLFAYSPGGVESFRLHEHHSSPWPDPRGE